MSSPKPKIIAIVGPTASGKTGLSIAVAERFQGEIISADSRQVYRGLDIGSGKVTPSEMNGISHHLLDIADPMTIYTASDFKRDGEAALRDIFSRHRLPIIAGGTFMYLDTLLSRISLPEVPPNPELRAELELLDTAALLEKLHSLDSARAETIDPDNPRRLIRAIEIAIALGHVPKIQRESPYHVLTIGISLPQTELKQRIHDRLMSRLEAGMVAEVESLLAHGVTHERLEDLGLEYRYLSRYLRGEVKYEPMVAELETKIGQFAKRQMTWLKRDQSIKWFHPSEQTAIFSTVRDFLED
jgi:tRNA dimethylallyltransferase